ncbi:Mu transposase C-terminal domain-containing protein [Bosea sp. AS-1]|uniref:Mu transposase C-terminal domain-containing protein n=1 Tax=Bosea sp. AS-1 TaxID=2015316 RepID=UPI000B7788C6|nr:Mu transposase C-terminal domain-containing protein [Bosea sp. AS-1]
MKHALSSPNLDQDSGAARRWRLEAHDKITIDREVDYVPVSDDESGHVLRRVDNPNLCESFTHEDFESLRREGRLSISRGFYLATKGKLRLPGTGTRITDLSTDDQIKVLWQKSICDQFLRMETERTASRSDASMKAAINKIVAELLAARFSTGRCGSADVTVKRPPSPRTLRRWLRRYEACGYNAMALVDGYHRCGDRISARFGGVERRAIQKFAKRYASSRKPTKAGLLQDLHVFLGKLNVRRSKRGMRPLTMPSRKAFEHVINQLDPWFVEAGRTSVEAARKKFYIVRGGLEVTRPFERLELDGNRIPLQAILVDAGIWETLTPELKAAIDRGRYWLSVAIDAATRCCVAALLVETLSAASAVATLEMAVNDKSAYAAAAGCQSPWDMHGNFETAAQDSGSEFLSHEYNAAVTDLGAEVFFPPAGMPQMRGRNERFFRTLAKGLFSRIDGQTFENVVAKGDYDAETRAVLDVAEIGRMIVRWIVDVYHNTPHSGLGGRTPRNEWLRLSKLYPVLPPPDADVNRHIFGTTIERRIGNEGLRVLGLRYWSLELQRLRRQVGLKPVLVRVNPADLGHVSVRSKEGWLTVPCQRSGFDGVSMTRWLEAERVLRRTNADMAKVSEPIVHKALSDIQEMSDAATKRAGIASPILTSEQFSTLESRFEGFGFARGPENGPAILDDLAEGADETETVDIEIPGEPENTVSEVSSDEDEYGVED